MGTLLGFAIQRSRLCSFGAIEDFLMGGDSRRLRVFALALGIALLGTQTHVVVAREATALAAAVAAAAEAVAAVPEAAHPALAGARAAMQSLHGLAGLSDLVPLGDILDALDSLLAEVDRHPSVPPEAAAVLRLAANAVSSMAQDVIRHGRPRDLAPAEALVDGIFAQFVRGEGTVSIDDFLLAGAERPMPGTAPAPASSIDLASLGERLRSGAAQLRAAPGPAVAALRAYGVLATVRRAPGGLGHAPAGAFLSRLAASLERRDAFADQGLIATIDQAGELLASGSDHGTLAAALAALAAQLPALSPVLTIEAPDEGRACMSNVRHTDTFGEAKQH